MKRTLQTLAIVFGVFLSWLGLKPTVSAPSLREDTPRLTQNDCYNAGEYARVITQDTPLNLRNSPGGAVIGAIPQGWEVVVEEISGNWAYVRSHTGWYRMFSAPDFNSDGWVSMDYLEFLGAYCDKPSMGGRPIHNKFYFFKRSQLPQPTQQQTFAISQDWTQLGDRISQSLGDRDRLNQKTVR